MISKINDVVKVDNADEVKWAAILDIFGFEIMNVFAAERLEYESEGIDPSCVEFNDNAGFIKVIDNEKTKDDDGLNVPPGIMKNLNSCCLNGAGTDQTFLADLKSSGYPPEYFEAGVGAKANEQD